MERKHIPDSMVHGANMGPIWGWQDPGGPHFGPMNFAIWDVPEHVLLPVELKHQRQITCHNALTVVAQMELSHQKQHIGWSPLANVAFSQWGDMM